jgi:hypothetical protein
MLTEWIAKESKFINNPTGSRLRGRPINKWWNCVQIDINNCIIGKRCNKLTGRRRRATLDCSTIEEQNKEEKKEKNNEEEDKKKNDFGYKKYFPRHK